MPLETELETFKNILPNLLNSPHRGKWAVIHGMDYDTWHCYEDALQFGYREYGLKPFLVKQVLEPTHVLVTL